MAENHIIVGLGGSGGKIIRQLRKTIEQSKDANGKLPAEVEFEFLYVDTSEDELKKEEDWQFLGKDLKLGRSQYLINLANSIRPVLDDPKSFPGLKSWIEPCDVFNFVDSSTAGAAQRRKLGRVVFAQNANNFVKSIKDRVDSIEKLPGNKKGAIFHVVCGLAGGTGSGSVVDAVAQIRHIYQNSEAYRIIIYAILPERNSKRVKDVAGVSTYYANGYAALAELNALAVGRYNPINVLDGSRLEHDIYFNSCYLVDDTNEHNVLFDINSDVPRIVAEFIFQKALNSGWEDLGRTEKGENEIKDYESDSANTKDRSKRFLSFGIKRVIVPEEEIKEYLSYDFAGQMINQLLYNNFHESDGFVNVTKEFDWNSFVKTGKTLNYLRLSDEHLRLERGILEEDINNTKWKPAGEFWNTATNQMATAIRNNKRLEINEWVTNLKSDLDKVFDLVYRSFGVRQFYEQKRKVRREMAQQLTKRIEKNFFESWQNGTYSLSQLLSLIDTILVILEEKENKFTEDLTKIKNQLSTINSKIDELNGKFNNVGIFGKLTSKREELFNDIVSQCQSYYTINTIYQGTKFAIDFIPVLREHITNLRSNIDSLRDKFNLSFEYFYQQHETRLRENNNVVNERRIFNKEAIDKLSKEIKCNESSQKENAQNIRTSIIALAGTDVNSFELLTQLSKSVIIQCLETKSAECVDKAHRDLANNIANNSVLNVNIIERLQRQYDANDKALEKFVASLYEEAGAMITFDQSQVSRRVGNNDGGTQGYEQTVGIFMPDCDANKNFREKLEKIFYDQKEPTIKVGVMSSKLNNQLVLMRVASLMPVRFLDQLPEYKRHYDGFCKNAKESVLLHSEGNGNKLPSLFALTEKQKEINASKGPYILLARILDKIKERSNKTTGLNEWIFIRKIDGLPKVEILPGKTWAEVFENGKEGFDEQLQSSIIKEVDKIIDKEYKHITLKMDLFSKYKELVNQRFEESGEDDQDPEFIALSEMLNSIADIIGIPKENRESDD